jgi:hypothetical protein
MATINLSDFEGYMDELDELDDNELDSIHGGVVAAWALSGRYSSGPQEPVPWYEDPFAWGQYVVNIYE